MRSPTRKVFQGVFNALMLGALSFGASQALAAPASPAVSYGCSIWQQADCTNWCRSMHPFNPYVVGQCSIGTCTCAIAFEPEL